MRRKALAIAALIAAVAIPGAIAASGDADPTASPAARAEPAPRVTVALRLADVRVTRRGGRSVLEGVPTGRGAVRWLHPKQPARRMRARRVATLWAGVQERGSVRVRVDGRTVTLRRPRLAGGRFRADIAGAGLRGRVTLHATLRHHDRRIHDRCVLAPYAHCAGRDFTLRDLHRADLRGADLRAARFNGAFLHGAALAGADLRGADLRGATLTGADLRGAKLAGADLADATLERARVRPGQLRRAFLCNTRLRDRTLRRDHCGRGGPRLQSRSLLAAAPKKVRLTVAVTGPGSVTANRGAIRCPRTCRARYRKGAKVALTAKPAAGATFSGWSGRCKGKARTCRLRVRGASTVRAAFTAAPPSAPDPPRPPAPPQPAAGCPYAPTRDADDDGLFDCHELAGWTFNVHTPADLSRDGDGSERTVTSEVGVPDTDGDGVSDGDEYGNNADPRDGDTDHDGLDDEAELVRYRSDLNHADTDSDSRQAPGAPRSARLFDGNEVADTHTNPRNADTDGDSLTDYYELIVGSTNARVPELPKVDLVAVPGQSNVKVDLGYTVTETTGTEKESASSTQNSNSQTSSNGGSTETTHELSQEHTVGGGCHAGVSDELPDAG
ncbi:MAG TPA: pentapeptide repeat-containing protein, partial [Solirubrobacteraceae bacterium]|nr:pentapeptide repeat-containing protein [Solirubrobacteraceae bacterium]